MTETARTFRRCSSRVGLAGRAGLMGFMGLAALIALSWPVSAQDVTPDRLTLDLNRVDTIDAGCRISLVGGNGLADGIDRLVLELVLFDTAGTIERFMRVAVPPIGAGALRAVQFDIDGPACADIGHILINDVVDCAGPADAQACRDAIVPTSRTDIGFLTSGPARPTAPSSTDQQGE